MRLGRGRGIRIVENLIWTALAISLQSADLGGEGALPDTYEMNPFVSATKQAQFEVVRVICQSEMGRAKLLLSSTRNAVTTLHDKTTSKCANNLIRHHERPQIRT